MRASRWIVALAGAAALGGAVPAYEQGTLPLDRITLPEGFRIEVLARVPSARAMAWGSAGRAVHARSTASARRRAMPKVDFMRSF